MGKDELNDEKEWSKTNEDKIIQNKETFTCPRTKLSTIGMVN